MTRLIWDQAGERTYETGVDQGVLFVQGSTGAYEKGVVWNGLINVTESPSGAEANPQYADNIKYLNLVSTEEFGATIEAFTYPDEFEVCDGSAEPVPGVIIRQQNRRQFGFAYRTLYGNDLEGTDYGYKLHLVYSALASVAEKAYRTINETPEALTFSWEVTTTPVPVTGYKPTSTIVIDSTKTDPDKMKALEDILYGAEEEATLPTPDEVIALIGTPAP